MANCRLIVCEKSSRFGPALRRESANSGLQVVETRSLAGCEDALAQSPQSLIALEVTTANLESVIGFLLSLNKRYPHAAAAALVQNGPMAQDLDNLLSEAGAIAMIGSVVEAPELARMALQKLAQQKNTDPSHGERTITEFVADRLPWPAYAHP